MTAIARNQKNISRLAMIFIFIALIRTISEPLRLQYYSETAVQFIQIKPFLIGSLMCAAGLLAMFILSFYERYKLIIALAILVIAGMLLVKSLYL